MNRRGWGIARQWMLALGVASATARGATWHVATGGSDSDGTTGGIGDPFLTISNALAHASGNDTVLVSPGSYPVTMPVAITNSIAVRSSGGRDATLLVSVTAEQRPLYVNHAGAVFEGFTVTGGMLTGDHGGGAYLASGTISNCMVVGNVCSNASVALRGGGVYAVGGLLSGCIVSNNVLFGKPGDIAGGGGGLAVALGPVRVEGCTLVGNQALNGAYGGGAYCAGTGVVSDCTLTGNTATLNGGGLFLYAFTGRVIRCEIGGNLAANGGGIADCPSASRYTVTNCTLQGNAALANGGGCVVTNGTYQNCRILANTAWGPGCYGGGVLSQGANSALLDSEIRGNSAYAGGGISASRGFISGCTIADNTATNTTTSAGNVKGGGGVLFTGTTGYFQLMVNSTISSNRTSSHGGGVWFSYGTTLSNCFLLANVANGKCGGGAYVYSGGMLRNCLIVSNSAGIGGGLYLYRGGGLENCTVVGNKATWGTYAGAGVRYEGGTTVNDAVIRNTIVYFNTGSTSNWGDTVQLGTVWWYNSCTAPTNGLAGSNNIVANPLFLGPAAAMGWTNGNYRLQGASPCINAGANQAWMTGALDLDNHRRLDGSTLQVDIGCYEWVPAGTVFTVR